MLGAGVAIMALPRVAAAEPSFPQGAVIRTILKDYAPGELGGGATLFHEHMSMAPDLLLRFGRYVAEAQAVNRAPNAPSPAGGGAAGPNPDLSWMRDLDLMSEELAFAKREGIGCIVDAGTPDMGDIGSLRQIAQKSGMPIGERWLHAQPFYPARSPP
jgi:predicted metal-dependent phosphotriesterase family hydrolase